jgi:uncharacterized RDD family membrane protein YckC
VATARIIVNPTSSSRREFALPRTLVSIGRDPSNDVVLPDAMVSRRHAVIEYRGSQYYIRDCNSSNGSLVNGDRVSERSLRDGDLVAIGTARLLFRDDLIADGDSGSKVLLHPSAPRQQCSICQAEYRKGDLFCRQCGAAVASAPPKAVCTSCGTAVLLPARFCNACGGSLSRDEEGREITPSPDGGAAAAPGDDTHPPVASKAPASIGAVTIRPQPGEDVGLAMPADSGLTPIMLDAVRPARPLAGFGPRLLSGLIDTAIVLAAQAVLLSPGLLYWRGRELPAEVPYLPIALSLALVPLAIGVGALYYVYGWGARGATLGQRALGLEVEGEDGTRPPGLSRAFLRLLGYGLSACLFGIGFLMIAFSGRALHDRIAGTRVVKREMA